MLDRRAILSKIAALGWETTDYWLITGAAMVLHGAKDVTHDIDMGVTTALADRLIRAGASWSGEPGARRIELDGDVELFENWRAGEIEMLDGVPALSLEGIVEMKTALGRPKDKRDVALIRALQNPKTTRVYFVRHARPNYENHDDVGRELTPRGLTERHLAVDFLRDKNVSAVLSSPYVRAADTVRPLADALGVAIETVDDFRERRVDSGWIPDFDGFARRQWADFDYKLSDGESLSEVEKRNVAALRGVLSRHAGKTVAVGTHGTALSTLIHFYDPTFGFDDFMELRPRMPWIAKFTFDGESCVGIEKIDVTGG